MTAPVKLEGQFTGAFTGADVNNSKCSSKKCLRKNYWSRVITSKSGKKGLLEFTGFRAQSAPPETPVSKI
jgi:hypothetical protein